jgi:TetR/AcrR family transcriptional regulator, mexCD-oprJ operon repressor
VPAASAALEAADPDSDPPLAALVRLIKVSWREIERRKATAGAAAEQLPPEVQRRTHMAARRQLRRLVERGRREGVFRSNPSADWLVTSGIALMHAAVDEVRAGRTSAAAAQKALLSSIPDLWVAPGPGARGTR